MKSAAASCLAGLLAASVSTLPSVASAALFKCVARDGSVSYQADPCPFVADEKKLKEPPPGPVAVPAKAKPASPWKEWWVESDFTEMADRCVPGVLGPARLSFLEAAAARRPPPAFPEAEITPFVKAMCLCVAKRVGSTYTQAEFQRDRAAILRKMNEDAMGGGACKPEGALGEMIRGERQF